jgi:chaperonin GroES
MDERQECPLQPLFAFVVLEREKLVSKGGIIIPDAAQKTNAKQKGRVSAIGPAVDAVAIGDLVLFGQFSGSWIEMDGRDFYIVHEEDILARVKE